MLLLLVAAAVVLGIAAYFYKNSAKKTDSVDGQVPPVQKDSVTVTELQPPAEVRPSETPTALNATPSEIHHGLEVQEKVETASKSINTAPPSSAVAVDSLPGLPSSSTDTSDAGKEQKQEATPLPQMEAAQARQPSDEEAAVKEQKPDAESNEALKKKHKHKHKHRSSKKDKSKHRSSRKERTSKRENKEIVPAV